MKVVLACLFVLVAMRSTSAYGQESSEINSVTVFQARVNTNVKLSAQLVDAWTGLPDAGMGGDVHIGVGGRNFITMQRVFRDNQGNFSRTWRPTAVGKYRVVFTYSGQGRHLPSRRTVFINVTN